MSVFLGFWAYNETKKANNQKTVLLDANELTHHINYGKKKKDIQYLVWLSYLNPTSE